MGERESKMGNWKSKIGRFIEHKRKAKWAEKKQILSRPIGFALALDANEIHVH